MLDFCSYAERFLSTPSVRRATAVVCARSRCSHFYPRPPRGGRLAGYIGNGICRAFLSTPSVRRATLALDLGAQVVEISIHALREEGDPGAALPDGGQNISIHALREEGDSAHPTEGLTLTQFLSTPSARRATLRLASCLLIASIFLSTPSARRATPPGQSWQHFSLFLSTPSARRATHSFCGM